MSTSATPVRFEDAPDQRSIVTCNFRSAGKLSNESTRHLRTMHEAFARSLTHSLDLFLGSALDIKLAGVDQLDARDFISSASGSGYFVPYTVSSMQDRVLLRFGGSLLFPLLDLLLGGTGEPDDATRELTEIDDELLRSVTDVISSQLERSWRCCNVDVRPNSSIKSGGLSQVLTMEERVTLLRFDVSLISSSGVLELVLPMSLTNALIRASQTEASQRSTDNPAAEPQLRERLLGCSVLTSAELSGLHLSVGDLVGLRPGDVLNLHAPVTQPIKLRIADHDLFEMNAVRNNNQKAAQLRTSCR